METFLIKALQLILSLSILVLVHEFGHFLFARLFKVRVEKFYLFFDPWFALFRFKPKNSDTEYGVGWLPLGGYCKISGMIDESMDKEQMAQPPQPWEFRSKPAGQRLLIMVGGVLFNFLLAIFIYSMVLFTWGDTYLPLRNVTAGMEFSQTFREIGFRNGDILLRADDEPLERLDEHCLREVVGARTVTVLRDGQETAIAIPADAMQRLLRNKDGFANYRYPAVIDKVVAETAQQAGLREGDRTAARPDRGGRHRWPGRVGICEADGLAGSMSRKGRSPGNARCEGLIGRPETEFSCGCDRGGAATGVLAGMPGERPGWHGDAGTRSDPGHGSPTRHGRDLGSAARTWAS